MKQNLVFHHFFNFWKFYLGRLWSKNENEIEDLRRISVQRKIEDSWRLKIPELPMSQPRRLSVQVGAVLFQNNSHRSSCQSSERNNSQNVQFQSIKSTSRKGKIDFLYY